MARGWKWYVGLCALFTVTPLVQLWSRAAVVHYDLWMILAQFAIAALFGLRALQACRSAKKKTDSR
jgi:hypothetical protein